MPRRWLPLTLLAALALPTLAADDYKLGPDSERHDGVPQGKVEKLTWNESKIFPNTERDWWIYVPAQYDGTKPAAVMVFQDGGGFQSDKGQFRVPVVFDNLIHQKAMPVTIAIMINPGNDPKKNPPGSKRADGKPAGASNRSFEYDTLSDAYARFLLEEILPAAGKKYKLTTDPDGRGIAGSSSGAICAFTVAWQRPDQFRKVISYIGSFTNIRGGDKYPELVRAQKPAKPIRIFQQDGTNDIVNQFGSWPEANRAMAAAWDEMGYDHKFVVGDGAHNGKHGGSILPEALRWLWRDYKPKE